MPPIVALAARRHPEAYAAVIYPLRRGRILSVSRKDTGVLSAVGGKLEGAETSLQAAIREAGEEVGVEQDCLLYVQLVYIGIHAGRRIDAFTCFLWRHPAEHTLICAACGASCIGTPEQIAQAEAADAAWAAEKRRAG